MALLGHMQYRSPSAAKNKCVTLKTANKESQTLEIVKAIPPIAAFPVLYFISPVF